SGSSPAKKCEVFERVRCASRDIVSTNKRFHHKADASKYLNSVTQNSSNREDKVIQINTSHFETYYSDYLFLRTSLTAALERMWSNTCPYWFLRGTITAQAFTMEVFFLCQR